MNFQNSSLFDCFLELRGHNRESYPPPSSMNMLKKFLEYSSFKIKVADFIIPTFFIGTDINTDNGYIRATHLSNIADRTKLPVLELTPDNTEWYDIYKS